MTSKRFSLFALVSLLALPLFAQLSTSPLVTYAGNSGSECFYDVLQLSDGSWIVAGKAEDLDWIQPEVERIELAHPPIPNNLGTGVIGFLLHLSPDLQTLYRVVHFAPGVVEDIRYLKVTNPLGESTGAIFLSANTADTKAAEGGYMIARLNANFVESIPTALDWVHPVWAEGYPKQYHPWDVDAEGRVYYVRGQSHDYDWAALYSLNEEGQRRVVEHWRTHWQVGGGEYRDTPASSHPQGLAALDHSGVVLKFWGRCELRSWTVEDYQLSMPDGNGGWKQGRWPFDVLFSGPCNPTDPVHQGPGYTGYQPPGTPVYGATSICVDRRKGDVYLGMNSKSVLPGGNPDFEPAVIAFGPEGQLRWWSRLYHEVTPAGDTVNSSPDQYIDALAIDYSSDQLVVNGRCHGNNVENFWEGNTITANPSAQGFQNRFTGSSGNIHISWLGKLNLEDGVLAHSTYVAEYAEGTGGFGAPFTDPLLSGWPNPNAGWPNVNTTRLARNGLTVTADGSVVILGRGRRTITTSNAWQQMVLPAYGGLSSWNSFVRVYQPDLSRPLYSSLVVGVWDTLTQAGGGNTDLYGSWKTTNGVVAVGRQSLDPGSGQPLGHPIPTVGVPEWGEEVPSGESAILVYLPAESLENPADGPVSTTWEQPGNGEVVYHIRPNPGHDDQWIHWEDPDERTIQILDPTGRLILHTRARSPFRIPQADWSAGIYQVRVGSGPWQLLIRSD